MELHIYAHTSIYIFREREREGGKGENRVLGARVTSCLNELRTESVGRGRVVEIVISGEVKGQFTGDWRGEKREKEQNRSRRRRHSRQRSGDVSEETGMAEMGRNGKCTKTQNWSGWERRLKGKTWLVSSTSTSAYPCAQYFLGFPLAFIYLFIYFSSLGIS